jgi:tRNA pseudouridine55 synthase
MQIRLRITIEMARKNRGDPVHGWLVIDKGLDITSAKVVGRAKKIMNAAKVGHGGTLDPLATGVLPLAFGEATKTVSYMMAGKKTYNFTVCWGSSTDTDDAQGVVVKTSSIRPSRVLIESILSKFIGHIQQTPPVYSAIKVDGKRAYALARSDKPVKLESRSIFIEEFKLVDIVDVDHASFEVTSGKGAYVRGLARDIAVCLGTVGHVSELRRTSVGPFSEKDAISLDQLEELGHKGAAVDILRPVETALDDIPALELIEDEARRLRCGQTISAFKVAKRTSLVGIDPGTTVCAMAGGKVIALAKFEGGEIRPFRVLNF